MKEFYTDITVKEMGKRFAQIRKKLGLSQTQLADMLHSSQTRVSSIELGQNTLSPIFLQTVMFYLQHVSAGMLFSKNFDIEDPNLFDKSSTVASVVKARLQHLSLMIKIEKDKYLEELNKGLDGVSEYL